MVATPYYYDEFELSDEKNDGHIDDVVEDNKQGESIN
jgi:hypothetical protein